MLPGPTNILDPIFGDERERLPPSHHQAAGFPAEVTPEAEVLSEKMFLEFAIGISGMGPAIAGTPEKIRLAGVKRLRNHFDSDTSASLIQATRQRGISVSSAVHAALIVTTQNHASDVTQGRSYTSLAAFNYRPYLQPPYHNPSQWPMGAYLIGPPFTLPLDGFVTQARKIHGVYHQPVGRGESLMFDAFQTFSQKVLQAFLAPTTEGMPLPTTPELMSLGNTDMILNTEYKERCKVEFQDVEVVVDQIKYNILMYAWSFRRELYLSTIYNEAVYEDEWVGMFFADVQKTLLKSLGVSLADTV